MIELKTRVEELKMENEYQLRLKDMNYNEKYKDMTDKFVQEMEELKNKNKVTSQTNKCNSKSILWKKHDYIVIVQLFC